MTSRMGLHHPASPRHRWLVSEVVQTSSMDCGPAALKSLLDGFGISVSYGRLREACQTGVDGTSINSLEDVANLLGLDAEQTMAPMDHVLLPEARALPGIVVVRLASGVGHFVVAWRCHGNLVQVMDPATGRRWPTAVQLMTEMFGHSACLPAEDCRDLVLLDEFLGPLGRRLRRLGLHGGGAAHIERAAAAPGWRELAALDASTRTVESMTRARAIRPGREATRVLEHALAGCQAAGFGPTEIVAPEYWTMLPAPAEGGEEQVFFRGAVLIRVRGRRPRAHVAPGAAPARAEAAPAKAPDHATPDQVDSEEPGHAPARLSPELAAALAEPRVWPGRELLRLLRQDGALAPLSLFFGVALVAAGSGVEALLFRSLFELGHTLGVEPQRLGGLAVLAFFLVSLGLLDLTLASGLLRLGRHLDTRLRMAFLRKIPLLGDRYFHSRPISDMAERGHSLYMLHLLLRLGGQVVRVGLEIAVTAACLIWLSPDHALPIVLTCVAVVLVPIASQPVLQERELRVRVQTGSLARFYLDALLGLVAVRAHGAEAAVRFEHESMLVEWTRAGRALQRAAALFEALHALVGVALVAWLVRDYLVHAGHGASVLLFIYWALKVPVLGDEMALLLRQYPIYRNVALRLLEPLGAIEEQAGAMPDTRTAPAPAPARPGMALELCGVRVVAYGFTVLEDVDLVIPAGSHVAIVGPSGAGKSSLVGLFLGWHRPATGSILVDGEVLDSARLDVVRRETAWVDPAVHLWNRTLLDNLRYGRAEGAPDAIGDVLEAADLLGLVESLPAGLQTVLGEGGGLVSGGEGQRVRLGRAMLHAEPRLIILDEAFRGLDRGKRHELLAMVRRRWSQATLLCITHDVGETCDFERVLVVEGGRVVEDGRPADLAAHPGSRYQALLAAEDEVHRQLWTNAVWQRLHLER